jgi:hypothetical protein
LNDFRADPLDLAPLGTAGTVRHQQSVVSVFSFISAAGFVCLGRAAACHSASTFADWSASSGYCQLMAFVL